MQKSFRGVIMLKKIDNYFEEIILVFLLISMTSILLLQVISRYIFKNSLTWSEELVRYMLVWSTFIAVPYCIKKGISINVAQFVNMMPYSIRRFLLYFNNFIMFILFFIIAIFSFDIVRGSYISAQTSPAMGIPVWTLQSSVFVSSILCLIRIAELFFDKKVHNKKQ